MLNTFLLKKKGFTDKEIGEAIMSVDLAEALDCTCTDTNDCKPIMQIDKSSKEEQT